MRSDLVKTNTTILTQPDILLDSDPDVLNLLLQDKRSEQTRRAYQTDIRLFFSSMNLESTKENISAFLRLTQHQALQVVLKHKAGMQKQKLSEATINRRLSAIKSLVKFGRKLGVCSYTLEDVDSEKVVQYRDTTGVDSGTFSLILQQCDRSTAIGKRNYGFMRLLWGNALRRSEVVKADVKDFDAIAKTLKILGKGKGSQFETIDLGTATVAAIVDYLNTRNDVTPDAPLFVAMDRSSSGKRLTGDGLLKILNKLCVGAGITKKMSPHRVRHSAITAALDAHDGNVRKVQKLSRHAKIETLMKYDDNRQKVQRDVTELLDSMFD